MDSIKILIAGDFVARSICAQTMVNLGDYKGKYDFIKQINDNHDYSFVNLEAPIVLSDEILPIKKTGPSIKMNLKSLDFVRELGFRAVTLANNHFFDYGEEGVKTTLNSCREYGIDFVGGGMNLQEAKTILYRKIKNKVFAFVNICENEWSIATTTTAGAAPINLIENYYQISEAKRNADFVVVIVHGGSEMSQLPSLKMKDLFYFYIEIGADVVVNHHQHCFSGYEIFKGKPIFYGLGNFWFDEKEILDSNWNEGFLVSLSFNNDDVFFEIIPYQQCKEELEILSLEEKERIIFDQKIRDLNNIICDRALLEEEFVKLEKQRSIQFLPLFEPYNNRILKKMYALGLLPSFFSKSKKRLLLNIVRCESHYEILKSYLERVCKYM